MKHLTALFAIFSILLPRVVLADGTFDEPLAETEVFRDAWQASDLESAFLALKPSEKSANPHPVDLVFLAGLYTLDEIPNLGTKRERALRYWELSERAARTGYEVAVIELANAFAWGDEVLGYPSNMEVSNCLDEIIGKRAYVSEDKDWLDAKMVEDCLLHINVPAVESYKGTDSSADFGTWVCM